MKKILVITYYWTPCGGAGVQRWLKFCKYLPEFGVAPIVLTVDEKQASYPQIDHSLEADVSPDLRVERTDTRELYNLYKRFSPQKEIPYGGFSNEKKPNLFQKISRFIRGNFFLPDPRRGWNRFAFRRACALIEAEQIGTVITTSPPHSTQLIGRRLKKKYPQLKWIADLRDPYTDIYYYKNLYPTWLATQLNKYYERKILLESDRILTVSEDVKRIFAGKIRNFPAEKIVIIPNGYDEEDFDTSTTLSNRDSNKFVITYTGTMSDLYDIAALISAVKNLPEKDKNHILIRFVGNISPNIIRQIEENGLGKNVEYAGYVAHKKSVEFLQTADLLLLVIAKTDNNKGIVTGKIFEYLASRTPVLCIAPTDGDAAKIIEECRAGQTFDYADEKGMSGYLTFLLQEKEAGKSVRNSNNAYQKYSRKKLTELLANTL
ncbi:MAG: glycosyltransferase family 4 protein [Prevotellaceae bacterium]|jgi:glycosyltransferase involved in cell wall biosynthesis|nr:glycosyltransferase family 4 protein [Prevotellaceae bacterium]